MIPYIYVPDVHITSWLVLRPFGMFVFVAVMFGVWLTTMRARQRGVDLEQLSSFLTWMLLCGFIFAHVLDAIFYHPDRIAEDWTFLIDPRDGLSSFGGFMGAIIGIISWKYFEAKRPIFNLLLFSVYGVGRRYKPVKVMPFCDLVLSVFPIAWIFGRGGCSVVHDHKGVEAPLGHFLAVSFPQSEGAFRRAMEKHGSGGLTSGETMTSWGPIKFVHGLAPHFDLGLIELFFAAILSFFLVLTWRKKLPTGSYIAVVCLSYAPVRFVMDSFRLPEGTNTGDARYASLTPAQWGCVLLAALGIGVLLQIRKNQKARFDPLDAFLVHSKGLRRPISAGNQ